jgi:hypothetical protein
MNSWQEANLERGGGVGGDLTTLCWVLKRIFGPKGEGVTQRCRKWHGEEVIICILRQI